MQQDTSGVQIEVARTTGQIDQFRRLCTEYAQSLEFDLCFQGFGEEMAGLPGAYAEPEGVMLLARQAEHLTGCVALKPLEPPLVCEMKRLWVRPEFRHSGIGRQLLRQVIGHAQRRGYRQMRLDTIRTMSAATRLYRSVGFREIEPYTHNPLPDAVYLELLIGE